MLELAGLSRAYGPIQALSDVSFRVESGRLFGFLGPNGAGKTTTMRAILGLVNLDSGRMTLDGQPIDESVRRRFGYLPEERGLFPSMRLLDQLVFFGRIRGLSRVRAKRAAEDWLGRVGLAERSLDRFESLSLGNKQRAQLAACLLHEPEVLLLDEPFSSLDPIGSAALSALLVEHAKAGGYVVFSSHQIELVQHLCQDVAVIVAGRTKAEGPVSELTGIDRQRLEVRVAGDGNAGFASRLRDVVVERVEDGTAILKLGPRASVNAILSAAAKVGEIERFSFASFTLTDAFNELVNAG
jgi:ABC-2 type transport system ATP-binding protein